MCYYAIVGGLATNKNDTQDMRKVKIFRTDEGLINK